VTDNANDDYNESQRLRQKQCQL